MTSDDALAERLHFLQKAVGRVPSPFDCYMVLRGLKTLARAHRATRAECNEIGRVGSRRTRRSSACSIRVSRRIPARRSRRKQMKGPGGMISFELRGGLAASTAFLKALRVFACAESLGGVESLAEHPGDHDAREPHRRSAARARHRRRPDSPVVGIEDAGDLREDLERGFAAAQEELKDSRNTARRAIFPYA